MGVLIVFASAVVAGKAAVFERILQKAVDTVKPSFRIEHQFSYVPRVAKRETLLKPFFLVGLLTVTSDIATARVPWIEVKHKSPKGHRNVLNLGTLG